MRLNKRVIESTIVAGMLAVVTAVTAVGTDAKATQIAAGQTADVVVTTKGVAGVIGELANTQAATEEMLKAETVSREKADTVTVAEAVQEEAEPEEPQLTAEEQEWSNKLMANVDVSLNVRSAADENSEIVGKLRRGDRAEITETLDGWFHIVSGNVDGFAKAEYCVTGTDALNLAKQICKTQAIVVTSGLRERVAPSEDSEVYGSAAEGDKLTVKTDAETADGWVVIDYNGSTAYVKAEYVTVAMNYGSAITIEEEQAELARIAEEEAAKKAAQAQKAASSVTQNAAVSASCDDVTLLGALIQCEAGSEPYEGMVAVGAVVMNRLRSGVYPSSIYGVIYDAGQFTPAGSGSVAAVAASGVSGSCLQAAQQALGGYDNTGGATCFRRASSGQAGVVIGHHVFY